MSIRSFGKSPTGKRLERIRQSPNYQGQTFRNLTPTAISPERFSFLKIMKALFSRPDSVRPPSALPHVQTDLKRLNPQSPVVIWFGHSSYMIQVDHTKILIDPVFSGTASPLRYFGKAFTGTNLYQATDLPEVDLLVLTHDHYDHLDWPSIKKIAPKANSIITSLGVGAHLEYWGIATRKVVELDWWESYQVAGDVRITATPARHFSGRGLKKGKTLWSSFVLQVRQQRIFLGGDSGYDQSFRSIGEKFGPFDLAFLECGQYGKYWPQIHMFPEQTVLAGRDLGAEVIFPVHWGKFVLSTHPWNEPVKRFVAAAEKEGQQYTIPKIGEPLYFNRKYEQQVWWELE